MSFRNELTPHYEAHCLTSEGQQAHRLRGREVVLRGEGPQLGVRGAGRLASVVPGEVRREVGGDGHADDQDHVPPLRDLDEANRLLRARLQEVERREERPHQGGQAGQGHHLCLPQAGATQGRQGRAEGARPRAHPLPARPRAALPGRGQGQRRAGGVRRRRRARSGQGARHVAPGRRRVQGHGERRREGGRPDTRRDPQGRQEGVEGQDHARLLPQDLQAHPQEHARGGRAEGRKFL
eukprot:scaffold57937_cov60-Phaeocystis_antarctica.AAC.4